MCKKESEKDETKKSCFYWVLIVLVGILIVLTSIPLIIIAAKIADLGADQLAITCTLLVCLTAIIITEIIGIVVICVQIAHLTQKDNGESEQILMEVYKKIFKNKPNKS